MEKNGKFLYIIFVYLFFSKFLLCAIQVTLTADPNIACIGCSIYFSANSPCNLTGATFYWEFGDGSTTTTDVPFTSHVYNSPGNYTASVLVIKSNDSGSANTSISIKKLGNFIIDAERVFDIPGNPLQFHIHAFQVLLTDTNGNIWDPSASRCMHVLYWWVNCFEHWRGEYSSGHVNEFTFPSIFEIYPWNSTAVQGIVSSECGYGNLQSNIVYIYFSRKVE